MRWAWLCSVNTNGTRGKNICPPAPRRAARAGYKSQALRRWPGAGAPRRRPARPAVRRRPAPAPRTPQPCPLCSDPCAALVVVRLRVGTDPTVCVSQSESPMWYFDLVGIAHCHLTIVHTKHTVVLVALNPVHTHAHTHTLLTHTKTRTKTINMRAREPLAGSLRSPRVPDPPQNRARLLAHASRQAAATGVRRRTRDRRRARRRAAGASAGYHPPPPQKRGSSEGAG